MFAGSGLIPSALRRAFYYLVPHSTFQNAGLEPLTDESQNSWIDDPVRDHPQEPHQESRHHPALPLVAAVPTFHVSANPLYNLVSSFEAFDPSSGVTHIYRSADTVGYGGRDFRN